MIAGILLAAGQSDRFGSDKRRYEIGGKPLIYYSLRACVESALPSVYVIVDSAQSRNLARSLFPESKKIRVIENPVAKRGQMSSLKAGLQALPPEADGAMIVLADMPLVTSRLVDRLMEEFDDRGTIVIPEHGGTRYHPRILPRDTFAQFLALRDDEKGTVVLDTLGDRITTVEVPDRHLFLDIDEPGDLNDVARRLAHT